MRNCVPSFGSWDSLPVSTSEENCMAVQPIQSCRSCRRTWSSRPTPLVEVYVATAPLDWALPYLHKAPVSFFPNCLFRLLWLHRPWCMLRCGDTHSINLFSNAYNLSAFWALMDCFVLLYTMLLVPIYEDVWLFGPARHKSHYASDLTTIYFPIFTFTFVLHFLHNHSNNGMTLLYTAIWMLQYYFVHDSTIIKLCFQFLTTR
jgi:hypothetical protein